MRSVLVRLDIDHKVSDTAHQHRWQDAAVLAIKVVHTAVFAVISTAVLHVFWAGVRGRPTRWTGAAVIIVLTEAAVFFGNRWRCPLTELAEALGADSGRVTDIFLPRWFADRIPQFFTPPFLIGVLALVWRRWRVPDIPPTNEGKRANVP